MPTSQDLVSHALVPPIVRHLLQEFAIIAVGPVGTLPCPAVLLLIMMCVKSSRTFPCSMQQHGLPDLQAGKSPVILEKYICFPFAQPLLPTHVTMTMYCLKSWRF